MYRKYKKDAKRIAGYVLLFLIKLTKTFFFMPPGSCRYIPSCSNYAKEAVEKYNIFKAIFKITIRVIKCNPLSKGGYDPV